MGLYLAPTVISGLAYSRCSINVSSRMWHLCPQSLLALVPSNNGPLQKVDSGPHIYSPLSLDMFPCLNHRRPNSLSSSSCSPNEILAAGPLYKTDKQEGNLAEVGEENRVPILGLPVPSVASGTCRDTLVSKPGHTSALFGNRLWFSLCGPTLTHSQTGIPCTYLASQPVPQSVCSDWLGKDTWPGLVQGLELELFLGASNKKSALCSGLLGWLSGRQNLWVSTGEPSNIAKSEDGRLKRWERVSQG